MKPLCCLVFGLALASCAQVNHLKTATVGGISKVGGGLSKVGGGIAKATDASMAKLMPARMPVVEVREKDLKTLPSGQEQAVAFEKSRRNRFWNIFSGPVDFQEPALPAESAAMDGDLLPPKME